MLFRSEEGKKRGKGGRNGCQRCQPGGWLALDAVLVVKRVRGVGDFCGVPGGECRSGVVPGPSAMGQSPDWDGEQCLYKGM